MKKRMAVTGLSLAVLTVALGVAWGLWHDFGKAGAFDYFYCGTWTGSGQRTRSCSNTWDGGGKSALSLNYAKDISGSAWGGGGGGGLASTYNGGNVGSGFRWGVTAGGGGGGGGYTVATSSEKFQNTTVTVAVGYGGTGGGHNRTYCSGQSGGNNTNGDVGGQTGGQSGVFKTASLSDADWCTGVGTSALFRAMGGGGGGGIYIDNCDSTTPSNCRIVASGGGGGAGSTGNGANGANGVDRGGLIWPNRATGGNGGLGSNTGSVPGNAGTGGDADAPDVGSGVAQTDGVSATRMGAGGGGGAAVSTGGGTARQTGYGGSGMPGRLILSWTEVEPLDESSIAPIFSNITPNIGPVSGATGIVISGSGFAVNGVSITYVRLGSCLTAIDSVTNTAITVSYGISCETTGPKIVTIGFEDQWGFTYTNTSLVFTFYALPNMDACNNTMISPTSDSFSGGTTVTISCSLAQPGKVTGVKLGKTGDGAGGAGVDYVEASNIRCATTTNPVLSSANCSSTDGVIYLISFTAPAYSPANLADKLVDIIVSFSDILDSAQTPKVFTDAFLYLGPFINMSLSGGSVDLEIMVTSEYQYDAGSIDVSVETNWPGGFIVSLHSDSADLTCLDAAPMPSMTGTGLLPVNSWGFGIGANDPTETSSWREIPLSTNKVTVFSRPSQNYGSPVSERVWVGFAADITQKPCVYQGNIVLTGVINL